MFPKGFFAASFFAPTYFAPVDDSDGGDTSSNRIVILRRVGVR